MIGEMSPLTRRIVAVGLLVLMVLLGLQYVALPLAGAIMDQRDELAELRLREARLGATMDRMLPKVSKVRPEQVIAAATQPQAIQRMQAMLAGDAAMAGVTLQLGPPCTIEQSQQLCADVALSGKEGDVAHFLSVVEHGSPVVRFQRWQLAPGQGTDTQLHFMGRAIAVWRSPA
jgi:Tfp pilus assembly protein PilO